MSPILNRDGNFPSDGFIHVVPKGELYNAEADVTQVLDDTSLDSILASIEADKTRLGNRWPGIYVGEEHHIYDGSKSSPALGWAKEFEKRGDGLWAKPELTDLGRQAIQNKRFKFTSFAASPRDLQQLGGNRARVLRIETIGLTNLPNGREMLTPIANRAGDPGADAQALLNAVSRIQGERKVSFEQAWNAARKQNPALFRAGGDAKPRTVNRSGAPSPAVVPALVAGQLLRSRAQAEQKANGGAFDASWHQVCNRLPQLSRIMNSGPEDGALAALEPAAHREYIWMVTSPVDDVRAKWAGEQCQWAQERSDFLQTVNRLSVQHPDLGYEGRWDKMKLENPALFWSFVATFSDSSAIP